MGNIYANEIRLIDFVTGERITHGRLSDDLVECCASVGEEDSEGVTLALETDIDGDYWVQILSCQADSYRAQGCEVRSVYIDD